MTVPLLYDPGYCRRRAAEVSALVETIGDPRLREILAETAADYEAKASRAESWASQGLQPWIFRRG
jgi:hypothetical protein